MELFDTLANGTADTFQHLAAINIHLLTINHISYITTRVKLYACADFRAKMLLRFDTIFSFHM